MIFFDLFGSLFSLISTYFYIRLDSKAWLVSIMAILINTYLYWQSGIYADTCLELFYLLSTIYGWYQWTNKPKPNKNNLVSHLSYWQAGCLIILGTMSYIMLYKTLVYFSHSTVAKLDAFTTTLSLCAQLLMCHKIIDTWILWLITDGIFAVMYYQKNLFFHSMLMIIYMGMACLGYFTWKGMRSN
ncbi:MAG: nicotinamide riboside transporter PnuC [Legionella sp.]